MIYTLQERLTFLLSNKTQKQLAKELGVSERTIRRWKNENVVPKKKNLETVTHTFAKTRKKKETAVYHRRDLRVYKTDDRGKRRWTGKYIKSDWKNYDVSFMTPKSIHQFVIEQRNRYQKAKWEEKNRKTLLGQFILKVRRWDKELERAKPEQVSLNMFAFGQMNDLEIWEQIEKALKQYESSKIVQFAILDPL